MLRTRDDYDRAVTVVREVIHAWDPYGLIGMGAPNDEWDNEIARIVAAVPRMTNEGDATIVISKVFTQAFQPEGFGPADCVIVGRQLFAALKESRLV